MIYDGRGIRLDYILRRGADYDLVIRWQADLLLEDWADWRYQISCKGRANLEVPVDTTPQLTEGFVIAHATATLLAPCSKAESYLVTVRDPNGLITPISYGAINFEPPVHAHA